MSEYGKVWEEIRACRTDLAELLGVPLSSVSNLSEAILLVYARAWRAAIMLSAWAVLETKAAQLDPDSGNER